MFFIYIVRDEAIAANSFAQKFQKDIECNFFFFLKWLIKKCKILIWKWQVTSSMFWISMDIFNMGLRLKIQPYFVMTPAHGIS